MLRHAPPTRRAGFTLIELLIVIAIIALIAALTIGAVMRTTATANEAGDVADIKSLEEAVGKFYARYQCFPPDMVKLCHYLGDYNMTNQLDAESVAILQRIWPQIFKLAVSSSSPAPYNTPIPWAGYNIAYSPPWPAPPWPVKQLPQHPITGQNCVVLQGDQCLVFFLGGPMGTRGFTDSTTLPIHDYANPIFTGQKPARVAFYEFPIDRLAARTWNPANVLDAFNTMNEFPSFGDSYKLMPFMYFSSNTAPGVKKGYNYLFPRGITDPQFGGISPYFEPPDPGTTKVKYLNPETFQIICAGTDHKFGPLGGQWSNGAWVNAPPNANEDWKDNHANFFPNRLGSPR